MAPVLQEELEIEVDNHTVVIAGAGAGSDAVRFAERANLPLFAEPSRAPGMDPAQSLIMCRLSVLICRSGSQGRYFWKANSFEAIIA